MPASFADTKLVVATKVRSGRQCFTRTGRYRTASEQAHPGLCNFKVHYWVPHGLPCFESPRIFGLGRHWIALLPQQCPGILAKLV